MTKQKQKEESINWDTYPAWIFMKCRFCGREHPFYNWGFFACEEFSKKYWEINKLTKK